MVGNRIQGTKVVARYPVQLTPGERRLIFALQRYFAPEYILPDAYFPREDGRRVVTEADLVQIDVVALDQSGVYVFESKDYGGWIYGHGERRMWTQVLNFGREKHQFYSPVLQNATHVVALKSMVGKMPVCSVVVFGREATLKVVDDLPEGCAVCTQANLGATLKEWQAAKTHVEMAGVWQNLLAGQVNPTGIVRAQHVGEVEAAKAGGQRRRAK